MSFQYNIFSNTMPDSDDPVANSYSHHDHQDLHSGHDHLHYPVYRIGSATHRPPPPYTVPQTWMRNDQTMSYDVTAPIHYVNENIIINPITINTPFQFVSHADSGVSTSESDYHQGTSNQQGSAGSYIAQQAAAAEAAMATGSTTGGESISLVNDGLYTYVDLENGTSVNQTSFGNSTVTYTPFKYNTDNPSAFKTHGTVDYSGNSININEMTTEHIHYFPIRGNNVQGYTTSNHSNMPSFPNVDMTKKYAKEPNTSYIEKSNINNYHSVFRLF